MPSPDLLALQGDEETFYAEHHARLRDVVRRLAHVSEDQLDDACAFAWMQFVRVQPRRESAFAYLVVVARREAWRLRASDARHAPLVLGEPELELPDEKSALHTQLDAKARLAQVAATLPERKRRLVALLAVGYSYAEIAEITGDSVCTVNRQLTRAARLLDPLRVPLGA